MVMQIKTAEIVRAPGFLTKVYQNEKPTIDHKAYRMSQICVLRFTWRLSAQRTRAKDKKDMLLWAELDKKIKKLREIERNLQTALETY